MSLLSRVAIPLWIVCTALVPFVVPATAEAAQAEAAQTVNAAEFVGKTIYGPKGERIGVIYKVNQNGDAQIIINGKMVIVPASTLALADGKLTTSRDKRALTSARS